MLFLILIVAVSAFAQHRRALSPEGPPCAGAEIAAPFASNDLVLDGGNLYFNDDNGGLFRIPKSGLGDPTQIAQTTDGSVIVSIVVDTDKIYFETVDADGIMGSVYSVPKNGGAVTQLAAGVQAGVFLLGDSQFLYWNSIGTQSGEDVLADGKIERIGKDGSGRTTLASGLNYPLGLALDGNNVLFGEAGIATGNTNAGLSSVPKAGGAVTKILDGIPVLAVTADANNIYAGVVEVSITGITGTVAKISKATGQLAARLASEADTLPFFLRIAGDQMYYYLLGDTDSIRAVPLDGGTPRVVVSDAFTTPIFVVDGCVIYYVRLDDLGRGIVSRGTR